MVFLKCNELSSNSWWNRKKIGGNHAYIKQRVWQSLYEKNQLFMTGLNVFDMVEKRWMIIDTSKLENPLMSNVWSSCSNQTCCLFDRDVTDELLVNCETIPLIVNNELHLWKFCAKLIPKNLIKEQKKHRADVCHDWLETIKLENILKRVITCDESWLFEYDPEIKRQSMQWVGEGEARLKIAPMSKSQVKTILVAFFDKKGRIRKEFLPQKTTMNAELYLNILRHFCERIHGVQPDLWAKNSWLFHEDNAPVHSAFKIRDFFAKNQVNVLDHPPYSPDLAPCTFFIL